MLTDESSLPGQILVNSVLSFLDLYSLIKFACTSKECKKIVFEAISKARWREINLSGNQIITDDQLSVFLENINAKENTAVLSLVGCVKIKGPGLEPLYGSNVMEDIDLRVCGSLPLQGELGELYGTSGLMEECVARILFSMIPRMLEGEVDAEEGEARVTTDWIEKGRSITLRRVAIRPQIPHIFGGMPRYFNYHDSGPSGFHSFFNHYDSLMRFEDAKKTVTNPEDLGKSKPKSCFLCFVQICKSKESSCPACNVYYCNACAMPPTCSECKKQKCQWCSNAVRCSGCNNQKCASHAYSYECCGACDKVFCQDCHDDELEICIVCNEHYCIDGCHQSAH